MLERRDLLDRWVGGLLGLDDVEIVPIEDRAGEPRDIAFEWFPKTDYLGEGEKRTRGANSTSVDAAVRFRAGGADRLLLIEWKYTESYGGELGGSHETRLRRYGELWRAPVGPIRADAELDLTDFFREPFYQLLRQQMLARAIETKDKDIARVDVVHISPAGNRALHRITSDKFNAEDGDAFTAFAALLSDECRDHFRALTTARAFASVADHGAFAYAVARYGPLLDG